MVTVIITTTATAVTTTVLKYVAVMDAFEFDKFLCGYYHCVKALLGSVAFAVAVACCYCRFLSNGITQTIAL